MKKTLLFLLSLMLCLSTSLADTRSVRKVVKIKSPLGEDVRELYKESHALVIGVSEYTKWKKLPGVLEDITAVRKALEEHDFEVKVVKNPKNRNEIKNELDSFISQHGRDPDNRLLFYYAGHGHTINKHGEDFGYIVPANSPKPDIDLNGFKDSAMDMQVIEVLAKDIDSKHVLFVFDSCFSGSMLFSLNRGIPENISYKTTMPVRQFITSGSAEENVPDKSIFRDFFVKALEGEADRDKDRYITGNELGEYLQKNVINYSRDTQHPQYGKIRNPNLDKGDFVFLLPTEDTGSSNKKTAETKKQEIEANQKQGEIQNVLFYRFVDGKRGWFEEGDDKKHSKYVGDIQNERPNGQGTMSYINGNKYVGQWKDGKRHGQGTHTYADGQNYIGDYKDDKRHGQGTYTYSTETKYAGGWKDNKRDGMGSFFWPDGQKKQGMWKDDKLIGDYKNIFPDSRKLEDNSRKDKPPNITEYDKEGNINSTNEKGEKGGLYYIVKRNDTLFEIAEKYKTTGNVLAKLNGIIDQDKLEEGQKLILPSNKTKPKILAKSKKYIPQKNEEDSLGFFGKVKKLWGDFTEGVRNINKKKWSEDSKSSPKKPEKPILPPMDSLVKKPLVPILPKLNKDPVPVSPLTPKKSKLNPSQLVLPKISLEDITPKKINAPKINIPKRLNKPRIKNSQRFSKPLNLPVRELPETMQSALQKVPSIPQVQPSHKLGTNLREIFPDKIKFDEPLTDSGIPEQTPLSKTKEIPESNYMQREKLVQLATEEYNLHIYQRIRARIINKLGSFPSDLYARIRLKIAATGKITDYEIIKKSGFAAYDKVAKLAVWSADLDPLPDAIAENPPYIVTIRIVPQN